MEIALESGYEIECALTVKPEEFSPMYHYPNVEKSRLPASLLGLDVKFCGEDELESIVQVYAANGVKAMISGAIASDYQKTGIEKMCTELGLISVTPLWRKDQELVLDELISRGIRAMLVSVSAEGLDERDLGRTIDAEYILHLKQISRKRRINIAGEGGEYETFVYAIPGKQAIDSGRTRIIWEGSHGYLIIGADE